MKTYENNPLIHPTALVEDGAWLGANVSIGPYSLIHANSSIAAGSVIESHCIVGRTEPGRDSQPISIGVDSLVRSHTVIYGGSTYGDGLQVGHGAMLRESTTMGIRCSVGSNADIEGSTSIGNYVNIHSAVFVAPNATIGDFAWLFPHVVLTDDPSPPSGISDGVSIGEYVAIGARSVILPGVTVGRDAFVAAGAVVTRSVEAGNAVAGVPAKVLGLASDIRLRTTNTPAYPWRRHFRSRYPEDIRSRWESEFPASGSHEADRPDRNE